MAHILCMTTGLTGILHSSFEVVFRLEQAGHRVTYGCPQDVRAKVEAQGFTYRQMPPVVFDPDPSGAAGGKSGGSGGAFQKWTRVPARRKAAVRSLGMDDFARILDELSPDLLLIDMELHDFVITALSRGVPVVLLSAWFSTWKRPGLPPLTSSLIPGPGLRHRLRIERHWWLRRRKEWKKDLSAKIRTGFTDRRSVLSYYARSVGLPRRMFQRYDWPPPLLYRSLPVASMTPGALEFPHPVRPELEYVGPMVHTGRRDGALEPGTDSALEEIFAKAKASGRAAILCSVSSMRTKDVDLLKRTVAAVAERPDWVMILGLGRSVEVETLGPLPDNVRVFPWIPQLRVLQHVDCCINPGGINTINECIHFGVPMLIYSGGLS
ncbi:MAG: hypothetical protein HKN73_06240, partial [Gemmatimonadetes bacterium]|nr:hypothetical protein [Gemmatimonadota bacterium]